MQGADPDAVSLLSPERLEGFREVVGDTDRQLVGRYLINAAVSTSLHPHLHALEIILRNRLYTAIESVYPVDPDLPHLYNQFPCWLDMVGGPVAKEHRLVVAAAKAQVAKDLRRRFGAQKGAARRFKTPGRLIAALPFSFWVFLFDTDYSGSRASPGPFWPILFEKVFSHHQGRVTLGSARKDLRYLLVVRNRVMHYERIWPYQYQDGGALPWDPKGIRGMILGLVDAMSPRAAKMMNFHDRLPEVLEDERCQRFLRWLPGLYPPA